MKFVCLGYIEAGKFEGLSESERNAVIDGCFAYDDALRKHGHFAGLEALQPPSTAATLRYRDGRVVVTDGDSSCCSVPALSARAWTFG